jgi:uncharacterized protein
MSLLIGKSGPGIGILARLDHGAEIVGQITDIAGDLKIKAAYISAVGALTRAEIGFYDQAAHEYRAAAVEGPVEIASCSGNISLLEGRPFVHAHAVLSDGSGRTFAGHLVRGSIFAAELFLLEMPGAELHRMPDPVTGLKLWGEERDAKGADL